MTISFYGTFPVKEIDSAVDLDGVIIGAPFEDNIDFYEKGTFNAPKKIRESSQFFSGQGLSKQSIHQKNFLDIGDIDSQSNFLEQYSQAIKNILDKNALAIALGGDHSIALGTAKGIMESKKNIDGIVWLDAHLDLMNEFPEGENQTRATVLRRIIDLKIIDPKNIYFLGIRGHNLGKEEMEFLEKMNIQFLDAFEIEDRKKTNNFLQEIVSKHEKLYLSLDVDVLDPSFAPGVSVPEPGGISSRELFSIIKILAKKITCLDIVEYNPDKDFNGITAKIVCKIIYHLIDSM